MHESVRDLEKFIDVSFDSYAMATAPLGKRDRIELGSSDAETACTHSECDIHESLNAIKYQLRKLDLLEQLTNDVKELKASLEFSDAMIEALKADNASLRREVNKMTRLTGELQNEQIHMGDTILDLQCRSMRDNIIFHGLPEMKDETHHKPEELVKTFLVQNLKMTKDEATAIQFSRVHRLGKPRTNVQQKSRPIVANVTNSKMKYAVMARGKELKNTDYAISDQFPPEIMHRRRLLRPFLTEARKERKRARLTVDKLYIDGQLYRNSQVTYWLSGGGDENIPHDGQETRHTVKP